MTLARWSLVVSCSFEAATGIGLILAPALLAQLVLGIALEPSNAIIAKIGGLALLSLALACWPRQSERPESAYLALLVYNIGAALLLINASIAGTAAGALLWPIALLHLGLGALFAVILFGVRQSASR